MDSVIDKIRENGNNIIVDNNFLFAAFKNRLVSRMVHIFEKYKIPMNKDIINKNLEENLINHLTDSNEEIIDNYINLLNKYEKIINDYVSKNTDSEIIKKSTMGFIDKISLKNKTFVTPKISTNFIEYINSIIYVYDNNNLNQEITERIHNDVKEIINEFNRNNYNFVIESINLIIKNIIKNM
jgi:hypothetical protein